MVGLIYTCLLYSEELQWRTKITCMLTFQQWLNRHAIACAAEEAALTGGFRLPGGIPIPGEDLEVSKPQFIYAGGIVYGEVVQLFLMELDVVSTKKLQVNTPAV